MPVTPETWGPDAQHLSWPPCFTPSGSGQVTLSHAAGEQPQVSRLPTAKAGLWLPPCPQLVHGRAFCSPQPSGTSHHLASQHLSAAPSSQLPGRTHAGLPALFTHPWGSSLRCCLLLQGTSTPASPGITNRGAGGQRKKHLPNLSQDDTEFTSDGALGNHSPKSQGALGISSSASLSLDLRLYDLKPLMLWPRRKLCFWSVPCCQLGVPRRM